MNKSIFKYNHSRVVKYSYGDKVYLHFYGACISKIVAMLQASKCIYDSICVNGVRNAYITHRVVDSTPAVLRTTYDC